MLQLSGYGLLADGTPHINGKPATPCGCDGGLLCGEGGPMLPWLCPECGAHLGASGICLNACHLTGAQLRRFEQGMREAAQSARSKHNGEIYAKAAELYGLAQERWPSHHKQPWAELTERDRQRWIGEACSEMGTAIW